MKKSIVLIYTILVCSVSYGQDAAVLVDKTSADWRPYNIPEVSFFMNLYQDDYLGDTLEVGEKIFFSVNLPLSNSKTIC